jgi:hypothetical protein
MRHLPTFVVITAIGLFTAMTQGAVPAPGSGTPAGATAKPAPPPAFEAVFAARSTEILDALARSADTQAAIAAAGKLLDQSCLYASLQRPAAFRDAVHLFNLAIQLDDVPRDERADLLAYLRKNEALARSVTSMVAGHEKPARPYRLLHDLRLKHGDKLNDYPEFTAAFCVVHDKKMKRGMNENTVESPDAMALFDYYLRHEREMVFGLKSLPAELMVYAVDSMTPIDQMEWALKNYHKASRVGELYKTIQYDHDHFRSGSVKKVTQNGYSLPNIKQFGGVCIDQAHFCAEIGKAIGVPTAVTTGRGSDVGHAWIGFLEPGGKGQFRWNGDYGRYTEYQFIQGQILDTVDFKKIPDGFAAMIAGLASYKAADRHASSAMVFAALRILSMLDETESAAGKPAAVEPPAQGMRLERKPDGAAAQQLIESALKLCPHTLTGWDAVRQMAERNRLTTSQKNAWADRVLKFCLATSPEFCLSTLKPMIGSIKDLGAQDQLWTRIYPMFEKRKDLASEILVAQGEMWLESGDIKRAGQCYEKVIERFPNAGPFVVKALERTEELLIKAGLQRNVTRAYGETWARTEKPSQMAPEFVTQSNWFNIGRIYAARLADAGDTAKSAEVVSQLEKTTGVKVKLAG